MINDRFCSATFAGAQGASHVVIQTGAASAPIYAASIHQEINDIEGWLLPEEAEALYALAQRCGDVILEVGTFRGRSAAVLTKGALNRHLPQFYSLDINPSARLLARNVLKRRGLSKNALFFHGTLSEFRKAFAISPTMAFIDGDRAPCRRRGRSRKQA